MDETVKSLSESIKGKISAFKNYDTNQKTVVLTVFVLIASIAIAAMFYVNRVNYKVLYSNMALNDAGKIVKILKEKKVNYKLQDDGKTILVPAEQVYQLRLELAETGLPKNGELGFELFDKSDFSSSEFAENIKYIRALQGELMETVNSLDAVEDSKINLTIPKRQLYADEDTQTTASVVLSIQGGKNLSDEEVRGIANLVASSVEGLKPENVTIMTTDGKLLSDFIQESSYGLSTYQAKLQKQIQKQIESKIKGVLDSVVGSDKSVVNAHIELKMEQKAIQKEMYQPTAQNMGIVRSSRTMLENYDTKKPDIVSQNTQRPAPSPSPGAAQTATLDTESPMYKQRSTTVNYEISKVIENQTVTPGEINRMTVGVVIDQSAKLSPQQVEDLKAVISSVCGIDSQRGDVLTIRTIQFIAKDLKTEKSADEITTMLKKYGPLAAIAIVPVLLIFVMLMVLRGGKKPAVSRPDNVPAGSKTAVSSSSESTAVFPEGDTENFSERQVEGVLRQESSFDDLQETIKNFARKNPKVVANIFEKWVTAGD